MKVLLAEDEPNVAGLISKGLGENGHEVTVAQMDCWGCSWAAIHLQDPFENKPTDKPMTTMAKSIETNLMQLYSLQKVVTKQSVIQRLSDELHHANSWFRFRQSYDTANYAL